MSGPERRLPGLTAAWLPSWPVLTVLAGSYTVLACLSTGVSRQPGKITAVWYANAAAVVLLARAPRRYWPAMLWVVAMVNAAVNRLWGDAPMAMLAFLPPNLLEILLGAWALQRAGLADSALHSPATLLRLLLLGGVLPQALAAGLAALSFGMLGREEVVTLALTWYESTVLGALSVLPAALLLANQNPQRLRQALGDRRLWLLAPLAVLSSLLCLGFMPYPFVYLALPLLAAAMLLDMVAVVLLTALVSMTVALGLASGVFVPPPAPAYGQAGFITLAFAAALVPALLLAAAVADLHDNQSRARSTPLPSSLACWRRTLAPGCRQRPPGTSGWCNKKPAACVCCWTTCCSTHKSSSVSCPRRSRLRWMLCSTRCAWHWRPG